MSSTEIQALGRRLSTAARGASSASHVRSCPLAEMLGAALKQLAAAADRSNAGHDAFEAQAGLCADRKNGDRQPGQERSC